MGTRITGSTKLVDVLVALAQRSADKLGRDAAMADLAPAMTGAIERLVQAKEARKKAANARWLTRKAAEEAEQILVAEVRTAQSQVLVTCAGNRGAALYLAMFPRGMRGMTEGAAGHRDLAARALAQRLKANANLAAVGQRIEEALAAHEAAVAVWKQACCDEGAAVQALGREAHACELDRRMAWHQVTVRLKSPSAARAFFPAVAPKEPAAQEPEPPGTAVPPTGQEQQKAA
jgi:hypothetical protein